MTHSWKWYAKSSISAKLQLLLFMKNLKWKINFLELFKLPVPKCNIWIWIQQFKTRIYADPDPQACLVQIFVFQLIKSPKTVQCTLNSDVTASNIGRWIIKLPLYSGLLCSEERTLPLGIILGIKYARWNSSRLPIQEENTLENRFQHSTIEGRNSVGMPTFARREKN